jgi:hypothetical protein
MLNLTILPVDEVLPFMVDEDGDVVGAVDVSVRKPPFVALVVDKVVDAMGVGVAFARRASSELSHITMMPSADTVVSHANVARVIDV